jgi:hypothetical protein
MTSPGAPGRPSDFPKGGCAATGWTPRGDRNVYIKQHNRGGFFFLEVRAAPRQSTRDKHLKAVTSLHPDYPGMRPAAGPLGDCYASYPPPKKWDQRSGAKSAIKHFRHWVDHSWQQQSKSPTPAPRLRGKPRGKNVEMIVRTKRKASRKAESNEKLKGQLEADIKSRHEQIEKLKKVLLEDDVSQLFYHAGAEEADSLSLSKAQAQRLTTQGWAIVQLYMRMNQLTHALLSGDLSHRHDRVSEAAAREVAPDFGTSYSTLIKWERSYRQHDCTFTLDKRGKWARELLINEEDLKRIFTKWMVRHATSHACPRAMLRLAPVYVHS